jgi:hypothetical protein
MNPPQGLFLVDHSVASEDGSEPDAKIVEFLHPPDRHGSSAVCRRQMSDDYWGEPFLPSRSPCLGIMNY